MAGPYMLRKQRDKISGQQLGIACEVIVFKISGFVKTRSLFNM